MAVPRGATPTVSKLMARFLVLVGKLGDEGAAAGRLRISKEKLLSWVEHPVFAHEVEKQKLLASNKTDWMGILFEAKVIPRVERDAAEMEASGQTTKGEGDSLAAWVALRGVENERAVILSAASKGDTQFFVALGKYLNSDWNRTFWDATDEKIAKNWQTLRAKNRRDAATWMQMHGFPELDETTFRQRLVSLKLTKRKG